MSTRLIQLGKGASRAVALIEEPHLRLLTAAESIYALANESIGRETRLSSLATEKATGEVLDYASQYEGRSQWHILPAIDHPDEPARSLVSGTGLTHLGSVPGKVAITRSGHSVWSKQIRTGEAEMCHSLQNIEQHHFKFVEHRRPGDVHIHFLGADCLSFGEGARLSRGDLIEIHIEGFGRPLRNTVLAADAPSQLVSIRSLG